MAVFSSRKGQALEALVNALGRCEIEGVKIARTTDDIADNCVSILIFGAVWDKDNNILLLGEEYPKV